MLQNAHRRVSFWTWQALYAEAMKEMLEQYFTGKPLPEENCIVRERELLSSQHKKMCLLGSHSFKNGDDSMEQRLVKKYTDEIKLMFYIMCSDLHMSFSSILITSGLPSECASHLCKDCLINIDI